METALGIDSETLVKTAYDMINVIEKIENDNNASIRMRKFLEDKIDELIKDNESNKEALDIATHAIEILRGVSDEAVGSAYQFLEKNLNIALERMFKNSIRKVKIKEYTRANQYPQLVLELDVGNGITRSLKTDSGHGIAQIVSLLSILSLIVITGSRRLLVIDEVLSGVSVGNRQVVDNILWTFTDIGFQFIINDHGFVIKNSEVYHLEVQGDVSSVKHKYIANHGVYLQGNETQQYDYTQAEKDENELDEDFNSQLGELEKEASKQNSKAQEETQETVNNNGTYENAVISL